MLKRLIIMIILIAYIFSLSELPVQATESNYRTAEIVVDSFGNCYTEEVLINKDNMIFVPITWFTRYGLMVCEQESNRYVVYHVGEETEKTFAKRIYIDKYGRDVSCGCYVSDTQFCTYLTHRFSEAIITENSLYLPITDMLPLINAKIEITDDGILHINANALSVFSALYDLNLSELSFDADVDIIGYDFMTASGMLIDTILDLRIDRLDGLFQTGEYMDYRDLFKAYLTDDTVFLSIYDEEQSPLEKYIENKKDKLKDIDQVLSDAKIAPNILAYVLDSELYPEFHDFKDLYSGMSDTAEGIYKIADYCNTYMKQVDDHLNMLEAVYSDKYFGESNPAYKAAKQVFSVYGADSARQRKEIVHSTLYDFIVDEFGSIAVKEFGLTPYSITFKAVKLALPEAVEEVGKASQLGYMDDVVNHACKVFEKRTKKMQFDADSLDDLRLTAMLAMVASRHAYNMFWEDHYKVNKINKVLEKLYLAADGVEGDSVEYYSEKKSELENTLNKINVSIHKDVNDIHLNNLNDSMFNGTYWSFVFGERPVSMFSAKFNDDGTFEAQNDGSGMMSYGFYTYSNGKLTIGFYENQADYGGWTNEFVGGVYEFVGDKNGFVSVDKHIYSTWDEDAYGNRATEDYYLISPY